MNPYVFNIGGFGIRWYSLLILIGAFLGISMFIREGKKHGLGKDLLFNMAFWVIIFGIIGARIYYVLFNLDMYQNNLMEIFKIWNGGLAIHGGIIAGAIVFLYYTKRYEIRFYKLTDYVVPSLILAQAIGRWGNFFNQEAHGVATSIEYLQKLYIPKFVIDGMQINGIYYIPTFYFESLFCLIGFIILIILKRLKYVKVGTITSVYLMYYGVLRFFIESMRTDSLMIGGFKVAQIVSVIAFLIGLVSVMIISQKGRFEDLYKNITDENIRY